MAAPRPPPPLAPPPPWPERGPGPPASLPPGPLWTNELSHKRTLSWSAEVALAKENGCPLLFRSRGGCSGPVSVTSSWFGPPAGLLLASWLCSHRRAAAQRGGAAGDGGELHAGGRRSAAQQAGEAAVAEQPGPEVGVEALGRDFTDRFTTKSRGWKDEAPHPWGSRSMMRFLESCSWISTTFSTPFTTK